MSERTVIAWFLASSGCIAAGGCAFHAGGRGSAGPPSPWDVGIDAFAYGARVERVRGSRIDSLRVIGIARNESDRAIDLHGRFDFGGGYNPCTECPQSDRPPTFYLIPASFLGTASFEGRRATLPPGGEFLDTLLVTIAPSDFEHAPGWITIEGSFWLGLPGWTFAEARCIAPEAFTVTVEVP